ncbi:hypothetical protein XENTR_v10001483 [Xenopus tropicalis]|nr:hypothetical protein XENTR_v10001483 [Xenopus tropicalis]
MTYHFDHNHLNSLYHKLNITFHGPCDFFLPFSDSCHLVCCLAYVWHPFIYIPCLFILLCRCINSTLFYFYLYPVSVFLH